jgi:hypothetical protein
LRKKPKSNLFCLTHYNVNPACILRLLLPLTPIGIAPLLLTAVATEGSRDDEALFPFPILPLRSDDADYREDEKTATPFHGYNVEPSVSTRKPFCHSEKKRESNYHFPGIPGIPGIDFYFIKLKKGNFPKNKMQYWLTLYVCT